MRIGTLTTSTVTIRKIVYLQERQSENNVIPLVCQDPCSYAGREAQRTGKDTAVLCDPNGDFLIAFNACQACILEKKPTLPNQIPPLLPSLAQFVELCDIQINATLLSEVTKSAAESAAYCAEFSFLNSDAASNCSESSIALVTITLEGLISSAPASRQAGNVSTAPSTPIPTQRDTEDHTGVIAGGVVGGVIGLALIGAALFFIRRRHRREATSPEIPNKAQLHSEDVKPDRKELEGSKGSRNMLEKQDIVAEMPANEEVEDRNKKLEEMPSNEVAGHEMETTENEIRALNSLARQSAGDSTLVGSGRSENDHR